MVGKEAVLTSGNCLFADDMVKGTWYNAGMFSNEMGGFIHDFKGYSVCWSQ